MNNANITREQWLSDVAEFITDGRMKFETDYSASWPSSGRKRSTRPWQLIEAKHVDTSRDQIYLSPALEGTDHVVEALCEALSYQYGQTITCGANEIHDYFGPYPGAVVHLPETPKQTTRMIKCECTACGFLMRASTKWVAGRDLLCPDSECGEPMKVHMD